MERSVRGAGGFERRRSRRDGPSSSRALGVGRSGTGRGEVREAIDALSALCVCQRSIGPWAAGREASISGGLTGSTAGSVGAWDLRGALSPMPARACDSPPLPTRLPRWPRVSGPRWRP